MWMDDIEPINHELIFKEFLERYSAGPKAPIQDYDLHYRNSDQRLMIMSNCTKGYKQMDASLIGHTSNPYFEKLSKNDSTMEALRDRTIKVDVPYLIEWQEADLIARKHKEELENARCRGVVSHEEITAFHNQIKVEGYEHLHVDYDFSLLDESGHVDLEGRMAALRALDRPRTPFMPMTQNTKQSFKDLTNPCGEIALETVIVNAPQYEGHPVGTPVVEVQTKCTCDIMALMAQGCKCGWLDLEKKSQADAAFEKERRHDLNSGGW